MKRLLLFFFAAGLAGLTTAFGATAVSALRVPSPASFEREVLIRLAGRPELEALLSGLAIEDAGVVAGDHYFDFDLKEDGDEDTYGFSARAQDTPRPAALFIRIHFRRPSDKTFPARISVTISDAEPADLKFLEMATAPNQPPHPKPLTRRG